MQEDRTNQQEARVWLTGSLSQLPVQPGRLQSDKMHTFIPRRDAAPKDLQALQPALEQLLQLFIEQQPTAAAESVLRNPQVQPLAPTSSIWSSI